MKDEGLEWGLADAQQIVAKQPDRRPKGLLDNETAKMERRKWSTGHCSLSKSGQTSTGVNDKPVEVNGLKTPWWTDWLDFSGTSSAQRTEVLGAINAPPAPYLDVFVPAARLAMNREGTSR